MFKYVLAILAILFLVLQYELWWAPDGAKETAHLKHVLKVLKKTQKQVREGNDSLQASVADAGSVEGRARSELGMVKKGEVFYQLVPKHTVK